MFKLWCERGISYGVCRLRAHLQLKTLSSHPTEEQLRISDIVRSNTYLQSVPENYTEIEL